MANYITIDGGTTNTRISLIKDLTITDTLKFNIGAKGGIENKELLKEVIKNGIYEILSKNNMKEKEVCRILASGMITSEFGLLKLEHISVPAGIEELHNAMCEVMLYDISNIPFVFMRGVKKESKTLEETDMMRGEETELMGIAGNGGCVYILPGSHSKIIYTDEKGRITDFSTALTGEMIAAVAENTILKNTVTLEEGINEEYLFKGFDYAEKKSINEAFFKVRILKNIFKRTPEEIYSFFMGAALSGEINAVLKKNPQKIAIGGRRQIKKAEAVLLKKKCGCEVIIVPDTEAESASAKGMMKIYEYKNCNCININI